MLPILETQPLIPTFSIKTCYTFETSCETTILRHIFKLPPYSSVSANNSRRNIAKSTRQQWTAFSDFFLCEIRGLDNYNSGLLRIKQFTSLAITSSIRVRDKVCELLCVSPFLLELNCLSQSFVQCFLTLQMISQNVICKVNFNLSYRGSFSHLSHTAITTAQVATMGAIWPSPWALSSTMTTSDADIQPEAWTHLLMLNIVHVL